MRMPVSANDKLYISLRHAICALIKGEHCHELILNKPKIFCFKYKNYTEYNKNINQNITRI